MPFAGLLASKYCHERASARIRSSPLRQTGSENVSYSDETGLSLQNRKNSQPLETSLEVGAIYPWLAGRGSDKSKDKKAPAFCAEA